MGILNVTPDSFSDGGSFVDTAAAIERGIMMAAQGADIIDIGGESTRPGATRMPAAVQLERVLPVIRGLRESLPAATEISIDTTLAEVADAALTAGAGIINDVSAGREDPDIFSLAAKTGVPLVLMHMQGTPADMQLNPQYSQVVDEIMAFLHERAAKAMDAGVAAGQIIIDPGIGFGKRFEHNLEIINQLHRLVAMGYPVLLGASRKKFLQMICNTPDFAGLDGATCAVTATGMMAGVSIFRVHDVRENRQTADVMQALLSYSSKSIK